MSAALASIERRPPPAPPRTPRRYVAIAATLAVGAQVGFVAVFAAGRREAGRADLGDPAHDEIAVAVEAVSDKPLLKYGAENPSNKESRASSRGRQGRSAPSRTARAATPTPGAKTPSDPALPRLPDTPAPDRDPTSAPTSAPTSDPPGAAAPMSADAADAGPAPASTTRGSALGSDAGTEIDPLKARAAASYRAQLDGWFSARFHIRGKVTFERLEKLSAAVAVSVSDTRHVVGFTIVAPSGDPIFDAQLRSDLSAIQSSGVELPAPPPAHPELLESTVHLRFACAIRAACE